MSAVHVPPKPIGWRREGTATGAVRQPEILNWRPCGTCAQQGRIYLSAGRGEAPTGFMLCPSCLGTGAVLS